ncbi:HK97 family phage prohead protease [Flavobacterium sp. Fl-318]|uniref:HK97 family phage prohead protease n=1 Tax=Flavobacterium cupriresistens TaxID=2893885 RepID=A0ABU4R5X1_9FLAO|nr:MULTISPECIES: HK97 family phage prohead protease [unclassified Flavobacterium]MDX6187982.1 HK97 family phage prohead protease [Flavobacterium sp. Fl-318]UFH42098.1 HK97 family phage prohead protease [Flavobacterium sp. F-323]
MQHDFVINTENVNEYKYRILTDGIDYTQYLRNPVVLYLHERDSYTNKGGEVIGRCIKLFVQDKKLIATIEFDQNDEFSKKIADKVAGGFIRMASMYADVIAASSEPELVKEGQLYETVTKCKLVEISIVPIGGNDDALKLSKKGGEVKLNKLNIKKEDMPELKTIALALGKAADTSESVLLDTISKIKLEKDTAETKVTALEAEVKGIRLTAATDLVEKAVVLGLIPTALKDSQIKAFDGNFEEQKAILSKLIGDKEAENVGNGNQAAVKEVILSSRSTTGNVLTTPEESFDYLQKHDAVKLSKIRDDEPAKYAQLAKDYQTGVRYKVNN